MPSRFPPIGRALLHLLDTSPFICPSCRSRKAVFALRDSRRNQLPRKARVHSRNASTVASVTTINAKKEIPHAFQKLHDTLSGLEHDAAIYVNLSQLKLALRGLESEDAVTRVAVLGSHGLQGARKLVRALLADPLVPEPVWEKQVADADDREERALLLRYGEEPNYDQRHPLVRTLCVPSSTLRNHNLEILIHAIAPSSAYTTGIDGFLTLGLDMANSASGRSATITYPVHKSIVYREGLRNLIAYAPIESRINQGHDDQIVKGVVDGSWNDLQQKVDFEQTFSLINVARAETAVDVFRKSLDNSIEYEHAWFDSGLAGISTWLVEGTMAQPSTVKPAVERLIVVITDNAEQAILREEQEQRYRSLSMTVTKLTREALEKSIESWAESAHTELRDKLDISFTNKDWRKTTWWKLFWRIDDVCMIASDILQRSWLVEAEKELIWIAGRLEQAGLLSPPNHESLQNRRTTKTDPKEHKFGAFPSAPRLSDLIEPTGAPPSSNLSTPYPQSISLARSSLILTSLPPLQSLAQRLLLHSISTTVVTSSLSSLLYISLSTTSVYEAGAIAAVGFVYAMRRLQGRWEAARREWKSVVREEGIHILRCLEGEMRAVVRSESMDAGTEVMDEGADGRRRAMERLRAVRVALSEVRR